MLSLIAAAALLKQVPWEIKRDAFGVPTIDGRTREMAFLGAGMAVAEDRLWQMEMSRHLAEGRMAEIAGERALKADQEYAKTGYTPAEIDAQFEKLSPETKTLFKAYADGVNKTIDKRRADGNLPKPYTDLGLDPEPWTPHDSCAIAIHLLQLFGTGGGNELGGLALLKYLKGRPETAKSAWDIFEDIIWLNDPSSPTTLNPEDDQIKVKPKFPNATRKDSEAQLASLPDASLFELLPGIKADFGAVNEGSPADISPQKALAMEIAAPFKTGSYCIVVSPKRSATGAPMLLSGPQMGFTRPSIVHEIKLTAPDGLNVAGMDVPGVPGVLIGGTPKLVWGITTAVADTQDIVASPRTGDEYSYGRERAPIEKVTFTIKVKDKDPVTAIQARTRFGPITAQSAKGVFSLHRAFDKRELESLEGLYKLYDGASPDDVTRASQKITMAFNLHYATNKGDIGWQYEGLVPLRKADLDPRLPVLGDPANEWQGMIPLEQMPHVLNPKGGLIVNWNNKPAVWWPNGDTPAWGAIFRNQEILDQLKGAKLGVSDLERAIWTIARRDDTWNAFAPFVRQLKEPWAQAFDGYILDGTREPAAYAAFLPKLRAEIFQPVVGDMMTKALFNTVLQPSLILRALQKKTHFDYLKGRSLDSILAKAASTLKPDLRYPAPRIALPGLFPIPYSNRGTYIQILELSKSGSWFGRSILAPGEAEDGDHSTDQMGFANSWTFKPSPVGSP